MENIKKKVLGCFQCKNAFCKKDCPLHVDVPFVIKGFLENKQKEVYEYLLENNIIPNICGILCPKEMQCSKNCLYTKTKGELIRNELIENYLNDKFELDYHFPEASKGRIVVVGAGPAGLTAAIILRKYGFFVDVIEAQNKIGGLLQTHIPSFRFDKTKLDNLYNALKDHINFIFNTKLGIDLTYEDLLKYDYQILACGTKNPTRFCHDENVLNAFDILEKFNQNTLDIKNKKIGVLGCGNVAIDCARVLKRLNNDVSIVYRRTIDNSPATVSEINEAKNDNIQFIELKALVEFKDGIGKFQKMKLVDNGPNERAGFEKTNEFEYLEYDYLIEAYGSKPNYDCLKDQSWFKLINDKGYLKTNSYLDTYFIGDYFLHPTTIVKAISDAKEVSNQLIKNYEELIRLKNDLKDNYVVLGGSFNPITKAHQEIINYVYQFITSNIKILPNGSNYPIKNLLPYDERVKIIKLVYPDIEIDDYETKQNFGGTVKYLETRNHPFFIIGSDSLKDLPKWIEFEKLVSENKFVVFTRADENNLSILYQNETLKKHLDNFYLINVSVSNLSSTEYRNTKSSDVVDPRVYEYLMKNNLF